MKLHIRIEHRTGIVEARGKSGHWYSQQDIDRAHAARKDPEADPAGIEIANDLDRTDWTDAEMQRALRAEVHDCPECRAAMAAGEQPQFLVPGPKQPRRPRWRELKRRVR